MSETFFRCRKWWIYITWLCVYYSWMWNNIELVYFLRGSCCFQSKKEKWDIVLGNFMLITNNIRKTHTISNILAWQLSKEFILLHASGICDGPPRTKGFTKGKQVIIDVSLSDKVKLFSEMRFIWREGVWWLGLITWNTGLCRSFICYYLFCLRLLVQDTRLCLSVLYHSVNFIFHHIISRWWLLKPPYLSIQGAEPVIVNSINKKSWFKLIIHLHSKS